MPSDATANHVQPSNEPNQNVIPHMDFLEAIQDLFDGVKISNLRKKTALDLYYRVLAHRLMPFDHRSSKSLLLPAIQKLLRTEESINDAAIVELADSHDRQKQENDENLSLRMMHPYPLKITKDMHVRALRSLNIEDVRTLLEEYYEESDMEVDDSFIQEADRVELIVEIYDIYLFKEFLFYVSN